MIRLSKMADYGIVLSSYIANAGSSLGDTRPSTARELAEVSQLPLPTVSKILKGLSRAGLLIAHRGKQGGYTLARQARQISVADMISAIDGPITLTQCSSAGPSLCDIEQSCPVRGNWRRITQKVHEALESLTLADMTIPVQCVGAYEPSRPERGEAKVLDIFSNATPVRSTAKQLTANQSTTTGSTTHTSGRE